MYKSIDTVIVFNFKGATTLHGFLIPWICEVFIIEKAQSAGGGGINPAGPLGGNGPAVEKGDTNADSEYCSDCCDWRSGVRGEISPRKPGPRKSIIKRYLITIIC